MSVFTLCGSGSNIFWHCRVACRMNYTTLLLVLLMEFMKVAVYACFSV